MTVEMKSLTRVDFDPRPRETEFRFPMTEAQREIWVSAVLDEDANRSFNLCAHLRIVGALDPERLRRSAVALVHKHSALRSRIDVSGETFTVLSDDEPDWRFVDLTADEHSGYDQVEDVVTDLTGEAFDLAENCPLRVGLIRVSDKCLHLVLIVHHIVCDGWSMRILLRDLASIYGAADGAAALHAPRDDQFTQFALRNALINGSIEKRESTDYWTEQLADLTEPCRLPPDSTRPPTRTYSAGSMFRWMDDSLATEISQFARRRDVSLFTVLLTIYAIWLSRIGGSDDVVVGVPAAGQPFFDMKDLVGHCANLLPFRCPVGGDASFDDILLGVQAHVADGYEHQTVTFGEILQSLRVRRDASMIPLVPVTLNVVSAGEGVSFEGCEVTRLAVSKPFATFELALDFYRDGNRLQLEAVYNSDLFSSNVVAGWMDSFQTLAASVIAEPSASISRLQLVDERAFAEIGRLARRERSDFDLERALPELVETAALGDGNKVAVAAHDGVLTYEELTALSNRFARHLGSKGVRHGDVVGVYLERSRFLPAVLIGILKSGAAYLPIDPGLPAARRDYMLDDAKCGVVVTQESLDDSLAPERRRVVFDREYSEIQTLEGRNYSVDVGPQDRAYVIYTSGSTGNPKGVEITHRNLSNFLQAMCHEPGIEPDDRLLAVTSISFDISVLELFLPLIQGAGLYVASAAEASDGFALSSLIEDLSISFMQATPSTWRLLLACGWRGKGQLKALCGGEALPPELIPALLSRGCDLWNMYGPTETTVWSTCAHITRDRQRVPIGRPVANNEIYILDGERMPVPPGVCGEIFIGGDGVSAGYIGRPERTAESFIEVLLPDGIRRRLYRTGDLGVCDAGGEIYHKGRIDFQLKVRGYRIEPGEIESRLAEHNLINAAVVDVFQDESGEAALVGYLRGSGSADVFGRAEARAHLKDQLPAYMIPQRIEWRDAFPLTANGKIDRRQLAPVDNVATAVEFDTETLSKTERELSALWAGLIGQCQPRAEDNFFEIGGHSLLAVRVIGEIRERFGVALPPHMIALETLRAIAAWIDRNSTVAGAGWFAALISSAKGLFRRRSAGRTEAS